MDENNENLVPFKEKVTQYLDKVKRRDFDFDLPNTHLYVIGAIIIFIFGMDLLTKSIVDRSLVYGQNYEIIDNFFYFTYVHNEGIAWSMFSGMRYLFIIGTIAALFGLFYFFTITKRVEVLTRLGVVMVVGGALGNLYDRIVYGYVRDFINFYIFNYDFPIFNIADIGVCVGICLIILEIFMQEYQIWKLSKKL